MEVQWLIQQWVQVPPSLDWLHPEEKKVFKQFRFAKKQQDWLLGRWTAKQVLVRYLQDSIFGLKINELAILPATDGAPEVFYKSDPIEGVISLSHSNGMGLCVVCPLGSKIGCDLEKIEPRSPAFLNDYFTEEERFFVNNTRIEDIPLMANLIWSAKESVLKALRTGLRMDTRQVQIKISMMESQEIWKEFTVELPNYDLNLFGKWQVKSGFVITMVYDQEKFDLNEIS